VIEHADLAPPSKRGAGLRIVTKSPVAHDGIVEVDGKDLSAAVNGVDLRLRVGEISTAVLHLNILDGADVDVPGVRVALPDKTRAALITLGWTPPA